MARAEVFISFCLLACRVVAAQEPAKDDQAACPAGSSTCASDDMLLQKPHGHDSAISKIKSTDSLIDKADEMLSAKADKRRKKKKNKKGRKNKNKSGTAGGGGDDGYDWLDGYTEEEDNQVNCAWELVHGSAPYSWQTRCVDCKPDFDEQAPENVAYCAYFDTVPEGKAEIPANARGTDCGGFSQAPCDGKGECAYCGAGNACCQWNDPLAPEICKMAPEAAFWDEWGLKESIKDRCVYPAYSVDGQSNYNIWYDQMWAEAMELLGGKTNSPSYASTLAAPDVILAGYSQKTGKGLASTFLKVGGSNDVDATHEVSQQVEAKQEAYKALCPALDDPTYALSNQGLFNDMTYYTYPFWTSQGSEVEIGLFCGARYTDDPSLETSEKAAAMAKTACDDMGELCGGFSVGTDPECCGNPEAGGCTEVIFLKDANANYSVEDPAPSFKTGEYGCNYFTYIKG